MIWGLEFRRVLFRSRPRGPASRFPPRGARLARPFPPHAGRLQSRQGCRGSAPDFARSSGLGGAGFEMTTARRATKASRLRELLRFLWRERLWWLVPMALVLVALGLLLAVARSS